MKIGYIKRVFLLCLLCMLWLYGEGQTVEIKRQNGLRQGVIIYVRDSTTQSTLLGAHVKIITEKDTIYMTTGGTSRGARYQQLLPDSVMVVAQYMGYQTVSAKVPTPAQVSISLPIKTMELNEVIVQGKEIAIINKGDTITYNISAFKVLKDASLGKLFENFPGVEIKGKSMFYMGEPVDQIKFDNQTLFGNHVALALETMKASDVLKIDFYKEEDDFNKDNKIIGQKKRTVANVTTKSKPKMIFQTNLTLAEGQGTEKGINDKETNHYLGMGNVVFSRVGETLESSVSVNQNVKGKSYNLPMSMQGNMGTIHKNVGGEVKYSNYQHGKYNISTNNVILDNKVYQDFRQERDYLPTENYTSRKYQSIYTTEKRLRGVGSENMLSFTLKDKSMISGGIYFVYSEQVDDILNLTSVIQDDNLMNNAHVHDYNKHQVVDFNVNTRYRKVLKKSRIGITLEGIIQLKDKNLDGWRLDSILKNTGDGREHTYIGQGSLSIPLAKKFWIAKLNESFTYAKYQSEKTALNTLTGTKDVVNSHEYNICNLNNQTELILEYSNYTKKVGITQAMVKVGLTYQNQEREEYFPTYYRFPRTFRTMNGVAKLNYNFSSFEKMSIQYSRYMEPDLDIEKLRGVMNDTDPLCLTIGNPGLDIPIVNEFKFSLNLNSEDFSRTCMLSLNLNISSDRVVENTRYFEKSTILEEYDNYIVPVGATLTTWENYSGYWNLSALLNYSFRSKPLKSTFRFMLMGIKEETPIFIQGKPSKMKSMNFSITPEVNTAFSTRFQATLRAATRLFYNDNGEHVNHSFTEDLTMNLTGIIAKDYTLTCSPTWKYQYDREISAGNFNDVILNISLNKKWGKKKQFSTKIEGYDLLNQTNGIRSNLKEDYFQITREATLGRHILLRCEYKF